MQIYRVSYPASSDAFSQQSVYLVKCRTLCGCFLAEWDGGNAAHAVSVGDFAFPVQSALPESAALQQQTGVPGSALCFLGSRQQSALYVSSAGLPVSGRGASAGLPWDCMDRFCSPVWLQGKPVCIYCGVSIHLNNTLAVQEENNYVRGYMPV